jgi:hypothetical protein
MSISAIAYTPVLGLPLVAVLGILVFLSLCTTASIAILKVKGRRAIPFAWHYRFAGVTIVLGAVHGILGISVYIGF